MNKTKAIVFDFGNVIININFQAVYDAFAKICFKNADQVKLLFDETQIFKRYESNEFTDDEFRDFVRSLFLMPLTDAEIDHAWNAILLDIPTERIKIIRQISEKYPIYLLSNTNHIHIQRSNQMLKTIHDINGLSDIFDGLFLSYEMEMWKPDPNIYLAMLAKLNLKAQDVVFLDDNTDNIISAKEVGLNAIQILPGTYEMSDFFKENGPKLGIF